jgi:hypothetical protein
MRFHHVACALLALGLGARVTGARAANVTGAGAGKTPRTSAEAHAPEEGEPVEASVAADQLGRVTYASARMDFPIAAAWSIGPQAELLRVGPSDSSDHAIVREFLGGAVSFRPGEAWTLELSALYGPKAFNIESVEGAFAVRREIGADWDHDIPPRAEVELAFGAGHFRWADGLGPAGNDVWQFVVEAKELWRATHRLHFTPQGMFFLYDKSLTHAVGDRLGSAMVLARVGAFAPPLLLAGGRAEYVVAPWIKPLLEADEILYDFRSGDATELIAGATFRLGPHVAWTLAGGALLNRAHGDLVPPELANTSLPIALTELAIRF